MTLISLAEYAKMHGKAPATVRQLVLRGGLPEAIKIGRNWVIDGATPYPDGRVKSGKYRNWRRGKMYKLNYHTGAGDAYFDTVEEAMAAVSPDYTQQSITIDDASGNPVKRMSWWGVEWDAEADEEEPFCQFGSFGYYGQWRDER